MPDRNFSVQKIREPFSAKTREIDAEEKDVVLYGVPANGWRPTAKSVSARLETQGKDSSFFHFKSGPDIFSVKISGIRPFANSVYINPGKIGNENILKSKLKISKTTKDL